MIQFSGALDPLSQRIVAALQADGRASWTRIAAVLGESERTIHRRGTELLRSGQVRVRGLAHPGRVRNASQVVLKVSCTAGTTSIAGGALARRAETVFAYLTTGAVDCVAELSVHPSRFSDLVVQEIGAIPGVASYTASPVLGYFRAMHQWRPDLLTAEEYDALGGATYATDPGEGSSVELDKPDQRILTELTADGRATYDDLARATGLSVQTVSRRVERLRLDGTLSIRAVFEPALIGLPVEVLLWLELSFSEIEEVGNQIITSPSVRYACALAGAHQLLVDAVFPSRDDLYRYLREAPWVAQVRAVEPTVVVKPLKRSGVLDLQLG
ncbi:Lrp/AsnC family transcriptional regulator [Nocardioides kongjuensis]|uniref:DNA-binding Lrp family transcriptional regulator n=1 Tax=Nocardioides kongjuensis TaxID=349522 RepID=A0A852R848_9ACTN|nr:Lrp/AsnC family transcriptional regulator [Nocardioides kongjuensis]NYD31073.1 DNA-binding Lrp family transcriptional regulator [Nocardioides kongjuensis]